MKIRKVNVFTKSQLEGYPALVVDEFVGETQEMQSLAKKLESPVCVFILTANNKNAVATLRFFTTTKELFICGHGAIAAASILFEKKIQGSLTFELPNNKFLNLHKNQDGSIVFDFDVPTLINKSINNDEIFAMLGLQDKSCIAPGFPYRVASIGSPKLIIPIKSKQLLQKLKPNYDLISKWSTENSVNGVFVYAQNMPHESTFSARSFNPISGNNEEGANSLAASALGHMLITGYRFFSPIIIEQGDHMKMPCQIIINSINNNFKVGGYTFNHPARLEDQIDNSEELQIATTLRN